MVSFRIQYTAHRRTGTASLPASNRLCRTPHWRWTIDARRPIPKGLRAKGPKGEGNGVQGERPYLEKAKRPPGRPITRTLACSPCSSENGSRSLPLRRRHPPPIFPKGCCSPSRPRPCWRRRAGRSCWNTSGSAHRYRANSSPLCIAHRWSTTPSWSSSFPLRRAITMLTTAACSITGWKSSPTRSNCDSPTCCRLALPRRPGSPVRSLDGGYRLRGVAPRYRQDCRRPSRRV